MKNTLKIIVSILIFASLTLITSCKREVPKGNNIICLIDFSDAQNSNERLLFYMTAIKKNIIPKLGIYDKITILPIDKASVTNSSDIFLANLSEIEFEPEMASPMEEEQIIQDNLKKYKSTLTITFDKKFQETINTRTKSNHGSDIFGALEVAKNKLNPQDDNYIILFSDMMNWSNSLKMEPNNVNFNYKTLDAQLEKIQKIDFENSKIIIITGEQIEVSSDHFNLVKTFWTKYFFLNNSNLIDYNSASLTKLDELIKVY